jgi:hypothetical protein
MDCVASAIPFTNVIFWLGANNHDKREIETRNRIKNKIITSNKNAVLAISVFDSKKSLLPDTSVDDPKEDVKLDNDGEDDELEK